MSWLRCRIGWSAALVAVALVLFAGPIAAAAEPNERALERVMQVQDRNTNRLMALKGVVGTATGLNAAGRPVIKVFTAKAGVPGIPATLEGVPVVVQVTGEIFALSHATDRFDRPVPTGVSTGHPNITAGTIACRVTDGTDVYALSNNHIYADENNASIGDNVLQPGPYDGGTDPDDAIGWLFAFEPIVFSRKAKNEIDAAIALSSTANLGTATPEGGYGTPNSTIVGAFLGQQVQKFGRTTVLTEGKIAGINATVNVGYGPGRTAKFVKQIIIEAGDFSAGGDSGSLIVTDDENLNPVGLLFAGSSTITVANRIDLVLDRFGVTVDDGSGTTNDTPLVLITSPTDGSTFDSGATILFEGEATDTEDDDTTLTASLVWTSDLDGQIVIDGSLPNTLSDGYHTITASVTDSGGATGSDSISITVGTSPADTVTITKAQYRFRNGELKVEATSTAAPIARLLVVGYGEMSYDAGKNLYKFRQRGADDPGGFVTVSSDFGGFEIKAVDPR